MHRIQLIMAYFVLVMIILLTDAGTASGNPDIERTKLDVGRLWQRSTHRMATVEVNKAAVGSILAPLLSYQFLLPMAQLRAGLGYAGARTRLRRFVRDLLRGQKPIKIGAVGGSVTWGQGTSNCTTHGWFSVLGRWLVDGFPGVDVTARNGAVPATPASYMVMCADLSVDPDVDLVLVEYQLNDGIEDKLFDNSIVMVMERLLRRLLAFPGKPAVVMMQVPSHGMSRDPPDRRFYETMEDLEGSLAQYYDVQYLSVRTALYQLATVDRADGFRWDQLFVDHHPGDAGNRIMADLVAYLIQETALDLLLDPFGSDEERLLTRPLPEPMYKGNASPASSMCIHGDQFRNAMVTAEGFEYVNEGTVEKPRWGFVANTTGSTLVVRLDTRRTPQHSSEQVVLFFHHLKSYEHMGTARFSCKSGCTCPEVEVDAHSPRHVSQTYQARLPVSQSEVCEVTITVVERTASGEHKFKVSGVVISETPDSAGVVERMGDAEGFLPDTVASKDEVFTRRRR